MTKAPRRLGLIVPALLTGGGVTTVARFIRDTAIGSGQYQLRVVSLSTARRDPSSVSLARPAGWFRGPLTVSQEWDGIPAVHVGAVGSELEFQRYRPRRALAAAIEDCDVVQVVCGSAAWGNSVIGMGKPIALQVATRARVERETRDANPISPAQWWRKAMTEITDRLDIRALRRADAIQVENPWMLEYAKGVNRHRVADVRYAPPGISVSEFKPAHSRLSHPEPYVLSVARFNDERKNVALLLDAYARMPDVLRASVRLLLAGSAPPTTSFYDRARELGIAKRITYVPAPSKRELIELYQGASVFVLPSNEEGFGMVILEAMACGVPVISTRSGGPEAILTDCVDGFLVPLKDSESMACRMEQLLRSAELNEEMGARARRSIEHRYALDVAGEVFIDVWERLAWAGSRRTVAIA
jgi:D-inositol-3-phosphate glycosyltransferase